MIQAYEAGDVAKAKRINKDIIPYIQSHDL